MAKVSRPKLTAAEKEARAEASFMKDRAAREVARRRHTADTFAALNETARICASALARKRAILRGVLPLNERRKVRRVAIRALMSEYRTWLESAPAWLRGEP